MDKKKWEQENVLRLVKKSRKGLLRVVFSRFGLMALLLILELVLLWMMWRWFNNDFEWFAAVQGVFVKAFARTNKRGAPIVTLVVTNLVVEAFLVTMPFSKGGYQFFYTISAGMILLPYLLSAAYFAKLTFVDKQAFADKLGGGIVLWRVLALFGVVYSFFLAWASGPVGLTVMSLLYAPGIVMYVKGKKERGQPYLRRPVDKAIVAVILVAAAVSVVMLATGRVSLV